MAQSDLYSLLKGFAGKVKSPSILIREFLGFIEKYAKRKEAEEPEWAQWASNTETKFWKEITPLVENSQCVLLTDGKNESVFIPSYCCYLIEEANTDIDKLAPSPFLNEVSMKLEIPEVFLKKINLSSEMDYFFEQTEGAPKPEEIVSLSFPQGCGSALLLASMIPRKLMEMSLLKIRNYLHSMNNKEYVLSKLLGQMQGKEKILRDIIDRIIVRPMDCLSEMERSADFPYLFWTHFCPVAKNDIKKKNDLLPDDLAALQAICVIEVCCSFYRTMAAKKREIDAAFMTLEVLMDHPPWHYTLEEIAAFTNDRGIPLLDIYSQSDLEDYIRDAISVSKDGMLPSWLVVMGGKNEQWFVKKERYLYICTKMLLETQQLIKTAIIKRWTALVQDYDKEGAMDSDADFEKLLEKQTKLVNPTLQSILEDPKLMLAYDELERAPAPAAAAAPYSRIFRNGTLLPYSSLYSLKRKYLLSDIKFKLPFWYSIPFIVAILAFFRKLLGKKKMAEQTEGEDEFVILDKISSELHQSARLILSTLVPNDRTLDEYLLELEDRWSHRLDVKSRQNLILDVQSLLKDNLRRALKVYKLKRITHKGLQEISSMLITRNPTLQGLGDQKSLGMYMELYMIKLLLNRRM
ncbi:MAG: hypothetical protein FWH38_04330 [Treponema sp.]|nr:hypothetical protein [Treponema sp.]